MTDSNNSTNSGTTGTESSHLLDIEVVYGTPTQQKIIHIQVPPETTVVEAIERSKMKLFFPDMLVEEGRVGIWNRACKLKDTLRQNDRIEVYRPLIADPRENRRRRAERAKEEGRANPVTGGRI